MKNIIYPLKIMAIGTAMAIAVQINAEKLLEVPPMTEAKLKVNANEKIEPVNRRVMGVCLIYTPLGNSFDKMFKGVFDGTSGHIWGAGASKNMKKNSEEKALKAMPFAKAVQMEDLYYMFLDSRIKRKAKYISESDNNLDPEQQPKERAEIFRFLNYEPHPGFPNGFGITRFRVWDEPKFPQNGAWEAEDFARYLVDLGKAFRKSVPNVQIGAGIYENNMEWNKKMLSKVAELDIEAIRFIEPHLFSFGWIKARKKIDEYYARIAETELLRQNLRPKIKLVNDLSHGNWRVDVCAWNIHPPGWKPPYYVSTDMAVGVHAACMLGMFWEEGVHAAQYFQFASKENKDGHFYLVKKNKNGLKLMPAGEVFKLYGKYFRGTRLQTMLECPSFSIKGDVYKTKFFDKLKSPLLVTQAAYDDKARRLVLFIVNKHKTESGSVNIEINGYIPDSRNAEFISINAEKPESTNASTNKKTVKLPSGPDPHFSLTCPPCSVNLLIVKGGLFSENIKKLDGMKCVDKWTIEKIEPISKTTKTKSLDFFYKEYSCDSTSFINLAAILERSGLDCETKNKFKAKCKVWIFSPTKRKIGMNLNFSGNGSIDIDGKNILPSGNEFKGKAPLEPGWNKLELHVKNGEQGFGFRCAVENKIDLIFQTGPEKPEWPKSWLQAPEEIAYINKEVAPDKCFPNVEKLHLASEDKRLRRAFLRWDLSSAPKTLLNKLKAEFLFHPSWARGKGDVWIAPLLNEWDIKSLNYKLMPSSGKPAAKINVENYPWIFNTPAADKLIKEWIKNPKQNFGISVDTDIEEHCGFFGFPSGKKLDKTAVIKFELEQQ